MQGSRGSRAVVAGVLLAGLLLVSGCQDSGAGSAKAGGAGAQGAAEAAAPAAKVRFSPASATTGVRPDTPVSVTAETGTLRSVTVADEKGRPVGGTLSADKKSWTASGPLRLARHYRVTATALDDEGRASQQTAGFATLKPAKVLETSISPLSGSTVGVGMPIIVRFSKPVRDRPAVEKALTVTSAKTAPGGWSWVSDSEVHYRTQDYWPAGNKVSLSVALRGVDAGKNVWGMRNRTIDFRTADSMVSTVDVARHTLTVRRNGAVARVIPVSTGKDGFLTRNGTKVVLEKHTMKVMDATTIGIGRGDPEYYRLEVPYALRVTWSGEFVHAAPWSAASQGRTNVSHGCVGMSTSNAIWLFNQTHVGDVIRVVNSPRTLEPGNGWTDWNVDWATWQQGSALA